MTETSSDRAAQPSEDMTAGLLAIVRSERRRWQELREYAHQTGDVALTARMDEASRAYADRSRSSDDHGLRMLLLPWVQEHFITNYQTHRVLSHTEAVEQIIAIIEGRPAPCFFDEVAGELHPTREPCDVYVPDGRSDICRRCDWREAAHR